jgi:hypothetical protein
MRGKRRLLRTPVSFFTVTRYNEFLIPAGSNGTAPLHLVPSIMTYRSVAVLAATLLCGTVLLPAATTRMPVDAVKPGMIGTGTSVFEGNQRAEFKVQILGVLRNVLGPRRNLILARLEGGPLAQTGVIAGMSGSPVFIDGQLVGAVSYSLGAFSKEPIAGITPIDEMIETTSLNTRRAPVTRQARVEGPLTYDTMAVFVRQAFTRLQPFAERPQDVQSFGLPLAAGADLATKLRPIATPIVLGGFGGEVFDMLAGSLRGAGFVPVVSGSAGAQEAGSTEPLQPGDALGVSLVSGDLEMAATGTVTYVDGDRVYAFGHPFYNLGPTAFPMTRAHVMTVLPSLMSSTKVTGVGEVIGTVQQDRATAIAGTLGEGPKMIPLHISLDSDRGMQKKFSFQVVNDQMFTPLLTYISILNTLRSYEREYGAATFTVKGKTMVKEHGTLDFEDVFTGESPSMGAAASIAGPITFLLSNDLAPVELESVDISISSTEQPRTSTLERVWVDELQPRAGRTVPLKILTRSYRGEEHIRTLPIDIPANAMGTLSLLVSDGAQLAQWEQREMRQSLEVQNIPQMIRALNNTRRNNRLYVRLLSSGAGAVVNGETLSALPPSVLAVLESDRNGGNFTPLRSAAIGQWEMQTEYAVSGSRMLTINVQN